jgi:protein-disulfide isomerase
MYHARMTPQRLTIITAAIAILGVAAILVIPRLGSVPSEAATVQFADQPRLGDPAAPVTMAIFEDFFCPSCASFALNVMPTIEREYVDTGRASVVYVNFTVIPGSDAVGRLGECVYRQSNDAFWEMKTPLYRAQGELRDTRRARELALTYAPGVDAGALDACMADPSSLEAVRRDTQLAQSLGLRGTPSVLVNGVAVTPTLADVRRAIDGALR